MGATQEMLETAPVAPDKWTYLRILGIGARILVGYILSVAAGALIFAVIGDFVLPGKVDMFLMPLGEWLKRTVDGAMMFFMLGLVFGIPYTIFGVAAWYYLLPRTKTAFLAVGAFCPGAAIFTLGLTLGGTLWFDPEMIRMIVVTIPSGLAAAYIFGAIGMGYGFGRWRFG